MSRGDIFQQLSPVDKLVNELNHDIGMAKQYTKWKNTEANEFRKMEENVRKLKAKSKKLNKDKDRLHKKLDYTCQKLDQTCQCLVNSWEKYTTLEKELEQVEKDLLATQVQLNKCFTLSTSHKVEKVLEENHAQRLKLLDELQKVNKKQF